MQGHLEIVKLLLQHGANPNYPNALSGVMPIHEAATCLSDDNCELFDQILEVLQKFGARINIESFTPGDTPILRSVIHRRPHLAAILLRRGADPNLSSLHSCSVDILTLTIQQGYHGLAKMLVRAGLDLDRVRIDSNSESWLVEYKARPRPLLDLCRLIIRRHLAENVTEKVNKSILPRHLKRLLLLQEAVH